MVKSLNIAVTALFIALGLAAPASAEIELSFYGGSQSSPHSRIEGTAPGTGAPYSALIGWEGKSFSPPPYYGLRAMWWKPNNLGFGVELTHTKAYAPQSEMPAGFSRLEFTDGHNILTANVMKRWPDQWKFITPYVGAGIGLAIPHVDVFANGEKTYGYQVTGPAAKAIAGVKYDLTDRWAVFTEYQFTYSKNEAELEGGGTMSFPLITNAINVGVALNF